MIGLEWKFETKNSGTIVADFANGDIPQYERATTMSMTFKFRRTKTAASSSGASEYGESEYGESEFSTNVVTNEIPEPYDAMLKFDEYSHAITTESSISKIPWYMERLPSDSPYESHLVFVTPGNRSIRKLPPFWAVITGVDDQTEETLLHTYLDVELFVIAEGAEFQTHDDVEKEIAV